MHHLEMRKSPWITNELKRRIYNRDYLKKKAISSNDPHVWQDYKQARNQTNAEIKKLKRDYFTKNLELNKHNMKKTWQLINKLSSRNTGKTKRISEINLGEQLDITSPVEIAEAFNSYFSSVGDNLAAEIPYPDHDPNFYLKPSDKTFSLQTPTVDTVHRFLSTIDEKKSVGLDKIPNKLLKLAADVIAPSLTGIFAISINTGIFPRELKASRVSPIFKSGTKTDPSNYRPISVIPVVAKIFEKIIFDQLYEYLNTNKLLSPCQSGFRSMHSTLTALIEATNSWSVNIDNGLVNGVVFIDLKKSSI